jgi:CRP-like cAMP-binding protein
MVPGEYLRDVQFFGGFDADALERVAAASQLRAAHRGDVLFEEREKADELYLVRRGRVAIFNRSPDGRESVLALMNTGDLFGEMPLFDGQGRSAGARALEPSELVVMPYEPVRQHFSSNAAALWKVVELMALRLRVSDEALADSVFLDVTGRTAKRLLELAGDSDEFQLPVTQEELAGMIGASRERVNKAIAAFIRLGWISQVERTYRIVDRRRLALRAT